LALHAFVYLSKQIVEKIPAVFLKNRMGI